MHDKMKKKKKGTEKELTDPLLKEHPVFLQNLTSQANQLGNVKALN